MHRNFFFSERAEVSALISLRVLAGYKVSALVPLRALAGYAAALFRL
ncbi:MAG TPA: hypothetical protein VHS32_04605 [Streptosporangiaceae bacterium]|nr:hypothetical protein [Streptosporangiaceae bacterium]